MFDQTQQVVHQRSSGSAALCFAVENGAVALRDLHQQGSAKAFLPRVPGRAPEVVFLNTSGGLTGGDQLTYSLDIGPAARILATTQTAERAYASAGGLANVTVHAQLGDGAHLDWLPQETILFDAAHLHRQTEIDLHGTASALIVESLVLGRKAMGEVLKSAHLTDRRMIRRNGRPFWAENLRIDADVLLSAESAAVFGGATAMATIAYIAQNAHDSAANLRALPCHDGADMAVSGWNGRCLIRILATDSWPLRQQIIRVITTLRAAPMPRVWQC